MIKVRVASLVVPETTAKESKIRVSFWGITCHVPPSLDFATDLALFAKAPPGVSYVTVIREDSFSFEL